MADTEAERLAQALLNMPEHAYMGLCPGPDTAPASLDPECPACQILTQAAAELRRLSADARRYAWLREGERKRLGVAVAGGSRLITKDKLRALMEFNFWCSPEELDAAIDQAMDGY